MSSPDFALPREGGEAAAAPARARAAPSAAAESRRLAFAAALRAGLARRPRRIPCEFLYDELGSALFEAITRTPEYGLTRADERLLRRHADSILAFLPPPTAIVELGSGGGGKARPLVAALARREPPRYFAIDVSAAALARCRAALRPEVEAICLAATFLDGLRALSSLRPPRARLLVLFLGGSIGNFPPRAAASFLAQVRALLRPADALLLGADTERRAERLLPAYDDAAGVTAAFNLNLLARINRELRAQIPLRAFRHEARFNAARRRVEMHLVARAAVDLVIPGAAWRGRLRAGESLWTESSHKFAPEEVRALGARAGFRPAAQWLDQEWPFAETLLLAP